MGKRKRRKFTPEYKAEVGSASAEHGKDGRADRAGA
jgi:hypothetical protein